MDGFEQVMRVVVLALYVAVAVLSASGAWHNLRHPRGRRGLGVWLAVFAVLSVVAFVWALRAPDWWWQR